MLVALCVFWAGAHAGNLNVVAGDLFLIENSFADSYFAVDVPPGTCKHPYRLDGRGLLQPDPSPTNKDPVIAGVFNNSRGLMMDVTVSEFRREFRTHGGGKLDGMRVCFALVKDCPYCPCPIDVSDGKTDC